MQQERYREFGAFLNACSAIAVNELAIPADKVRSILDWWLDRQWGADYAALCTEDEGLSRADAEEVAQALRAWIEDGSKRFPVPRR